MPRPRSPGYDAQREKILGSAAQLFAAQGYAATSMQHVADACGLSKATLYHYCDDKYALLVGIAETHVLRLQALVRDVQREQLPPETALRELIRRLLVEYQGAQHAQHVLTAEAKFLNAADAQRIRASERVVVDAFAETLLALRPELGTRNLAKPLTMLLFGMVNWLFMWMRPDGALDHPAMGEVVADLFLGGLPAVAATGPAGTPRP